MSKKMLKIDEKRRKTTIPLTIFDMLTCRVSFFTSIFLFSTNFDAVWKKNWVDLVKKCRFYDGQKLSQNVSFLHRKLRNWRVSLYVSSVLTQCRLDIPLSWISHTSVTTVWCWGSSFSPTRCIRCSRRWTRSCIRWWQNNGDECWWRLFISTVRPTLLLFKLKVHLSLLINWMWDIGKLVNLFGMKFRAILLSTSNLLQNMRKTLNQNTELLLHF